MRMLPVIALLVLAGSGLAQWEGDVRLTNDGASSLTSFPSQRCLAVAGATVHAVWYDYRDGSGDIYCKRSPDGGASWGADTRLTAGGDSAETPAVAASGQDVHVAWTSNLDLQVHYRRSTDGGASWLSPAVLTGSVYTLYPAVAADGPVVHIAWIDARPSTNYLPEVFYRRSTDGGATWQADVQLSSSGAGTRQPAVAFAGDIVHVTWDDSRHGLNAEIYYRRSTDRGQTWAAETRFTNADGSSFNGVVAAAGQHAYAAWDDDRDGNWEIYFKRSADGGASWGADTRLTNDVADSYFASIAAAGSCVHLTWMDARATDLEEWYKRSTDYGASWGADTRLTNSSGHSSYSTVAVAGNAVHVLWSDRRDGNFEIYYKRNPTGNPGIEEETGGGLLAPEPGMPTVMRAADLARVEGRVFDMTGREVTVRKLRLAPGVYFLREGPRGRGVEGSRVRKVIVAR